MKLPLMRVSMAYSPMIQDMPEEQVKTGERIGLEVNGSYNETDDEVAWQTLRTFCKTWFK